MHAAGVPIALVLEHRVDPYSVARTLSGVLQLLRIGRPVLQLRCDVSGLGLLCHGAHAAAICTRSSLRHLYPQNDSRPRPVVHLVRVVPPRRGEVPRILLRTAAIPQR